ncbi:MAG: SemiSWEET family sugar transporter [Chitinophagaceae bacterium]|jgi:MtN3 and saliva related transmembrane protein
MKWRAYLGYLGVVTGSLTFVPQVYKAWETRSVGDISIWMIFILLLNVTIWLIYGIWGKDKAMILANSIIMFLSLVLLYFKLTF